MNSEPSKKNFVKWPSLYTSPQGEAVLKPSFVLYADLLGWKKRCTEAFNEKKGDEYLAETKKVFKEAYYSMDDIINQPDTSHPTPPPFELKRFTDNLVLGYPLLGEDNYEETGRLEAYEMFQLINTLQCMFALYGHLMRGALSFGEHYMDDDFVFGEALIEAVGSDKSGGPPCIMIAKSARDRLETSQDCFSHEPFGSFSQYLLDDGNGNWFVDYLKYSDVGDDSTRFEIIEAHMNLIVDNLNNHKHDISTKMKYIWTANYHNYFCERYIAGPHEYTEEMEKQIIPIGVEVFKPRPISNSP